VPEMNAQDAVNLLDLVHVGGLATGFAVLVVTYLVVGFVTRALQGVGNRFADKRLLLAQITTLLRFAIYFVGFAAAIAVSVNLSREVLLAIGGTLAVTAGFALKDVAASVLAGLMIVIEKPFQVGDRVSFGGVYGEIASIGLRSVRLVTLEQMVVTIPNNKFLTDIVSSGNDGELDMTITMDFYVGLDQDIALAKRLVGEALTSCRYAYPKKPWVVHVSQVMQGNIPACRLRAKASVLDVQYEEAFQTDVTERVMDAFAMHGIQPPAILHRELRADRSARIARAS
jgi:small-conductance mechanosensitive channel